MAKDSAGAIWPALDWETVPWTLPDDGVSRSQRRRHTGDYSAAVPPLIADRVPVVGLDVLADAEDAATAITRFDEYVERRLGNLSGEIAPMRSILLRSESAASSQIENLTVGARQLALAELGERTSRNAQIVVGNVRAMEAAVRLAQNISGISILEMHHALLASSDPEQAGRWRNQQVWIGGSGIGPHQADFVPPRHERVAALVDDLVAFVARDDVPVLPHAALAHAQFETIHPFTDGNGRTGRAVLGAMLRQKGLTQRATLPISAGLLTSTSRYFDALASYRQGNPVPIIERVSEAAQLAVANASLLVDDLANIRAGWLASLRARRGAAVWRLVDLLVSQPAVNTARVADELQVSAVAALGAIERAVEAGILTPANDASRNRVWVCRAVLTALDEFAARAGRRNRH